MTNEIWFLERRYSFAGEEWKIVYPPHIYKSEQKAIDAAAKWNSEASRCEYRIARFERSM